MSRIGEVIAGVTGRKHRMLSVPVFTSLVKTKGIAKPFPYQNRGIKDQIMKSNMDLSFFTISEEDMEYLESLGQYEGWKGADSE
jgi:hypothetical protein